MRFNFKDKPLFLQIWLSLGFFLGVTALLFAVLLPLSLKKSFMNEAYQRLEESQEYVLNNQDFSWIHQKEDYNLIKDRIKSERIPDHFRIVRHLFLVPGKEDEIQVPTRFHELIMQEAQNQKEDSKRYLGNIDNNKVVYVIRKVTINDEEGYLVSYLWERYPQNLIKMTLPRILIVIVIVLLVGWLFSISLAKYLSLPLSKLQQRVREIAEHKWDQPVNLNRRDEIGNLGEAIEWMRCQLIEHNKNQQIFLQKVSHELKTPIMIIRSYVESIQDGIYPAGNLENSLVEITEETERLEKRVRSLLHLSKLEYLTTHGLEVNEFDFTELLKKIIERLSWRRTEVDWEVNVEKVIIQGDKEKLTVALENMLDNQIRYAEKMIKIHLFTANNSLQLCIVNDGPEIPAETLETIFAKFKKGNDGEFGLGLAIVKLIIDMHHGKIEVKNTSYGVSYQLELPIEERRNSNWA